MAKFMAGFFNFFLEMFFSDAQPAPRQVVYRNYSAGPFDFAEVS